MEIPDITDVPGAFDPKNDPYAKYADLVIAGLSGYVAGDKVFARGSFLAEVKAWRATDAALEKAIKARQMISQAETSAFLKAQQRVTTFIRKYMDASYWFYDAKIPPDVRAQIDGVLKHAFGDLAEELKEALLLWQANQDVLLPGQSEFIETIRAFGAAVSAVEKKVDAYVEVMKTLVHGASRIGLGFVPVVGPALDL